MDRTARVAQLEWANYAATLASAQVTPGFEVTLRPDVLLTSSAAFSTPDANHACLLRTTEQDIEDLIAEIEGYFAAVGTPATVFVSPACRPPDLPERLRNRGFVRQAEREAWMILEDLAHLQTPPLGPGVDVQEIGTGQALNFAHVFMAAFGMPTEMAGPMAQLLEPSMRLPDVHHYMAFWDDKPVGVCSLLRHEQFGILGSAGVLPNRRGSRAATNMTIQAVQDAKAQGIDTLMLQTTAGTRLERLLRINSFRTAFIRDCYSQT
jgi:hypothetical protein